MKFDELEVRLQELEERLSLLTTERERARWILDNAVEALSLPAFLGETGNPADVLERTAQRVRTLISLKGLAFYLLSEDGLDFTCQWHAPPDFLESFEPERQALIEDGTVAWALSRNKPVMVTGERREGLLLHALMAHDEPLGIMAARLDEDPSAIMDISLAFLTVVLGSTAGILKNSRLYRVINDLNDELRAKIERLEESEKALALANEAKNRFLANVSHEIRTPLNAILGIVSVARGEDRQALDRAMDVVSEEGQALLSLINDLLDLSKIEAGHMELERIPFNLRDLLKALEDSYRETARAKSLDFNITYSQALPQWVLGDSIRLRQVLGNLLGNAVKFTDQGYISLTVEGNCHPDEPCRLRFAVSDSGIGIASEGQSKLFQAFSQVDSSTSRRYGGTGLGLAISQQIVRAMGGEIEVYSALGEGAIFSFSVLMVPCAPPSQGEIVEQQAGSPLSILLVEDNATNRVVAGALLKKLGHRVTMAESGRDALIALSQESFDVVLMDIQMPGMDGLELTDIIRSKGSPVRDQTIPIIALTANVMKGDRERYLDAGMDGYLAKPVRSDDIKNMLNRFSPREKLPPAPERYVLDTRGLLERSEGDEALAQMVLDVFVEDLPSMTKKIQKALYDQDKSALALHAHALKGASVSVGALGLSVVGYRLQKASEREDEKWHRIRDVVDRVLPDEIARFRARLDKEAIW
ncbi:MAG: hypothetical protein CSA35_06655 [Dethiosulfovibrio peptidovorans]|nr:MAG: hypothetical protein CSA35_06655 [Dethiosulfovibrio peptidovorans]